MYQRRLRQRLLSIGTLLCSAFLLFSSASAKSPMQTYVEAMQPGTNLGNTLDAIPNEFSWGAPATTQAMIQGMAAKGYKSLRLPITWSNYMGPAPDYTIDPAWMDHVQQIVDWALAANLYVVVNLHHDSWTWLNGMGTNHDAVLDRYKKVWLQIATRFKDYPSQLSFESINEPGFRDASNQDLPDATMASLLDEVNTAFFNVVRGTGGGNATRPLVLPSVYTRADQPMIDSLKATMAHLNDPNLIATIHYYGYYPFSVNLGGSIRFDDLVRHWVDVPLDAVHDTFVASGIPVLVGEWGVLAGDHIEHGEFLKFHEYVMQYGRAKGLTMMLWDTGGVYNRTTQDWQQPDLAAIIQQAVTGRAITADSDLLFLKAGTPVGDTAVTLQLNGNALVSVQDNGTTLTPGTDYTLAGDTLTLKAPVLAKYATGPFGQKATLTLNADSGPAWKIHVRYFNPPVPAAFTTVNGGPLSIPVAFNGDVLATLESKYADGTNAGPVGWTSFPQWGNDFQPDYANNAIVLSSGFFASAPANSVVNLAFHFWSGRVLNYQIQITPRTGGSGSDYAIYSEDLAPGWNDWTSWTTHNLADTTQAHSGSKSLSITFSTWGGVALQHNSWEPPLDTSRFHTLVFWIHGGTAGGQKIGIGPIRGSTWGPGSMAIPTPVADAWQKVEIPLSSLGVDGSPDITGFYFQDWSGGSQPTVYIDDITLTPAYASTARQITGTPAPVITSTTVATGQYNAPFSYTITAVDNPVSFGATDLPPGLSVDPSTGIISGIPTAAGSYAVTLKAANAAGTNTETLQVNISPAPVVFTLAGGGSFSAAIVAAYNGGAQPIEVTTSPAGVPVTVTYNGSTTPPTLPGTYEVIVTPADANHAGIARGTLVITITALVRHAPVLNGMLAGSLQFLAGESFAVNGGGSVSGDLLAPGTPVIQLNGHPTFAGIVDAGGASVPANYSLTLNGGAVVRHVVRRVDPLALPVVTAPGKPAGTRDVTLNNASQGPGSFFDLRNLTLNGNAGAVVLPPGVYGCITVNGNSRITLGVAGAGEPAVYELQGLTLNGNGAVQVVGPVTLKVGGALSVTGTVGSAEHPPWLELDIAGGGLSVNGNATLYAIVTAPNGTVMINGAVHGRVAADRLVINGGGLLEDAAP